MARRLHAYSFYDTTRKRPKKKCKLQLTISCEKARQPWVAISKEEVCRLLERLRELRIYEQMAKAAEGVYPADIVAGNVAALLSPVIDTEEFAREPGRRLAIRGRDTLAGLEAEVGVEKDDVGWVYYLRLWGIECRSR